MKKIVTVSSKAIPLEFNNVDTDLIIPAHKTKAMVNICFHG
jgi:3-isopropylmalate dehydratase small subunit